jgi:hypothetical protein
MAKGNYTIPNSVFLNFGEDPDELAKKTMEKNMNFSNFNPGR